MPEDNSIKHQAADVINETFARLDVDAGWNDAILMAIALKDEGLLATEMPKK